jgi:hypothetical protein
VVRSPLYQRDRFGMRAGAPIRAQQTGSPHGASGRCVRPAQRMALRSIRGRLAARRPQRGFRILILDGIDVLRPECARVHELGNPPGHFPAPARHPQSHPNVSVQRARRTNQPGTSPSRRPRLALGGCALVAALIYTALRRATSVRLPFYRTRGWLRGLGRVLTLRFYDPRHINDDTSRGRVYMGWLGLARLLRLA